MLNINCYAYDEYTGSYALDIEHNADVITLKSEGVFEGCDLQLKYDYERKGWSVRQHIIKGTGGEKAPLRASADWTESMFIQDYLRK